MLRLSQLFLALAALLVASATLPSRAQERGYLGVDLQDLGAERARELGLSAPRGAFVVTPRRDSPAERAGLRAGDVILEIDGVQIDNMAAVVGYIGRQPPGANLKVVVWRSKGSLELTAMVGRFPVALSLAQQIDALTSQQKYADAVPLAERLVEITRVDPGPLAPDHLAALERLASVLEHVSRTDEAEALFRRVVELRESLSGPDHLDTAVALTRLAAFYSRRGRHSEADSIYRRVLAIQEKQLGPDHLLTAGTLTEIGDVLRSVGKYAEAEQYHRRALAIREKALGAAHPDVGWAHNKLANTLDKLGRYADAIVHYERMIAIMEAARGPEHDDVGFGLGNLGSTLRKMGRYRDAERVLRRAAAIRQKALGRDHANVAWTLMELGSVLYATANLEEAESFYRRALAIREKSLGASHPDVGWAHSSLGITLDALGRFEEAAKHFHSMIAIMQAARGPEHDDVGSALGYLGGTLTRAGRYREGEEVLRRALAIRERALGPDHADLGWLLETIAYAIRFQSRFAEAEPFALRSLANREKVLGPNSWEVARSLQALGDIYERQNRYAEAIVRYQRALTIMEKVSGSEHPDAAHLMISLSYAYRGQGRYPEGEVLVRRALAIYEGSQGPDHHTVADALDSLAYQMEAQDRYREAEPLYRRAIAIREKTVGPDAPRYAATLGDLANNLYMQSRYAEAEPLERRALAIREQQFGADHPELALSYSNLADIMRYTGRKAEAETFARRALALREKGLGPDHPRISGDLNTLALVLEALGRSEEAEPLYRRALEIRQKALGPDHPQVAWSHNKLGLIAENAKRWQEALAHYRVAAKIVSERALDTGRRWRTEDDEARRTRYVFRNLVDAAFGLSTERADLDEQLMDEAFIAAQWRERTETSVAMSQMAARFGTGDGALAALVREGQDLRARWSTIERRQLQTAGLVGQGRDEAVVAQVRQEFDAISRRLDEITAEIASKHPSYAELANPQPLAIKDIQNLLRTDEALVVFSHTGGDTYTWVVTREGAGWRRLGLGEKYLTDTVEKLRCGLDQTAWYGAGRQRCQGLIGSRAVAKAQTGPIRLPFDLDAAHELYDDLFSALDHLIEGKHILVVPSGPLTQLPFHVLVAEQPKSGSARDPYKSVAWLGTRQPVTVIPAVSSLKALREQARASKARRPFIGFANPILDGPDASYAKGARAARAAAACPATKPPAPAQRVSSLTKGVPEFASVFRGPQADLKQVRQLAPLPETTGEVCAVARSVDAPEDDLWLATRATERNVKQLSETGRLANYRVVHFATHGLIAGGHGELQTSLAEPAIVLTPPPDATSATDLAVDDGLLTATEVATLRMDADWVILSACNTAAGGVKGAEAFSGLARAFFYAGARALLVSHWEVYSSAAVELVTRAFEVVKANPALGRAEAMRRSMAATISQGGFRAHPAYWAPFVVVGEGAAPQ
jgi:tetratricopeptide (TPR) repeat protein/CHAT domain-containing protein